MPEDPGMAKKFTGNMIDLWFHFGYILFWNVTDFQNDKIFNQMIKSERKKNYVIHNFEHLCVPADSLLPRHVHWGTVLGSFYVCKVDVYDRKFIKSDAAV